ncbi:helix-turn-helix domain-containing protein [Agrobacterium tumefaciens]|uniref:helix-turn-helix domain-containing protein n=1 Tax=Agrobacterium tumefaciens TaxID=358 RepID=UPI001571F05A|nr:helix-turn-helix transcriptional regulator [Agrobacterium tumefaciens]WCJ61863.1 helix-turn-helix transcriptional regulator [Agrobacterium tumefaciens]
MLKANQIRAARALLNWSQGELVEKSGLSLTTIRRMEDDKIGPERSSAGNVATVAKIIEEAGVTFLHEGDQTPGGAGVRLVINPRAKLLPSEISELPWSEWQYCSDEAAALKTIRRIWPQTVFRMPTSNDHSSMNVWADQQSTVKAGELRLSSENSRWEYRYRLYS